MTCPHSTGSRKARKDLVAEAGMRSNALGTDPACMHGDSLTVRNRIARDVGFGGAGRGARLRLGRVGFHGRRGEFQDGDSTRWTSFSRTACPAGLGSEPPSVPHRLPDDTSDHPRAGPSLPPWHRSPIPAFRRSWRSTRYAAIRAEEPQPDQGRASPGGGIRLTVVSRCARFSRSRGGSAPPT